MIRPFIENGRLLLLTVALLLTAALAALQILPRTEVPSSPAALPAWLPTSPGPAPSGWRRW